MCSNTVCQVACFHLIDIALYTQDREDFVSARYLEFGPPEGDLEVIKDQQEWGQSKCMDNELWDGRTNSHSALNGSSRNWRSIGVGIGKGARPRTSGICRLPSDPQRVRGEWAREIEKVDSY